MRKLIRRPSPAMIVSLIALFVALGGTGYAVTALPKNSVGEKQVRKAAVTSPKIRDGAVRSRDIADSTIIGRDVRAGTLGGREIDESKLATVPRASAADALGGLTADQLKDHCPAGTIASGDACFEATVRPAQSYGIANAMCKVAGRRLATYAELVNFLDPQQPIAPGGEITADVSESSTTAGQLVAVVLLDNTGSTFEFIDATGNVQRQFRCAATPRN